MRTFLIGLTLIVGLSCQSRAQPAAESEIVKNEKLPVDFQKLEAIWKQIPKTKPRFYFGVPFRPPSAESTRLKDSPKFTLGSDKFYSQPWTGSLADQMADLLISEFREAKRHEGRYVIPKACGFHPDILIVVEDTGRRFELLICFGCREWKASIAGLTHHSEIDYGFIEVFHYLYALSLFPTFSIQANKAPEPTITSVTPPAAQEPRRP